MATAATLVLVLSFAFISSGRADEWDPQTMLLKSVTECREKFPDLDLSKLKEYIKNKDVKLKCFLDCLFRSNGILDGSKVVEAEAQRWLEAGADTLNKISVPVDLARWRENTKSCLKDEYADGSDKCSGAVKLFMCYLEGFPQKE